MGPLPRQAEPPSCSSRGQRSGGVAAGVGRVHPHSPMAATFPRQCRRQQAPHRHGRGDGCEGSHKNDLRGWRD